MLDAVFSIGQLPRLTCRSDVRVFLLCCNSSSAAKSPHGKRNVRVRPILAVVFFETFSKENPGRFPSAVTHQEGNKTITTIEPVKDGTDIQSNFLDMYRQEHPSADLQDVTGDMVTTSGSGLDPDITLENAEYQLDRVSSKWAQDLKRDPGQVRQKIEQMIQQHEFAPMHGLWGEKIVNVLELNLELRNRYGAPPA
jgi:potassium-transporting ATPase KdpC subunit